MVTVWSWLSSRLESEVLKMSIEHIELISKVAESALQFFKCFKDNDVECIRKFYGDVFNYEREADNIKRKILDELSRGYVHPVNREEMVRLALAADDIATYLKAATRRAILTDPRVVDYEVKLHALSMCEKVLQAVNLLKEAARALESEPLKALSMANDIETLEEETDDIRMNALHRVLKFCDHNNISVCLVAKEIIDSIENSSDKCEDSADVIRSIAILKI